jgi:phosphohistidine phosphatase
MLFGGPASGLALKKAGACAIRFEDGPKPGEGLLRWWLTPSQLRALG